MTLPPNAPPALLQVAQRYAETTPGVVTFRMHRVFDVHDPISSRHEDLVMNGVYADGVLARVHVVSYTIDGKAASAGAVSDVEQSWNDPTPSDVFAPPFDARNFSGYQYRSGGASTIDFTSSVRDAGHGNGSFTYGGQGNVVSWTYVPNALPPHADSAEISDQRAQVLPGYWAPAQETQEYKGRVGPFSATGAIQITYSDFRRFPDFRRALQALITGP